MTTAVSTQAQHPSLVKSIVAGAIAGLGGGAIFGMMMATVQRMIAEQLTERQRAAMMAVMQGGMPLQEVAERMGTNRNALYKLIHDGRQRLQKRMMREGLTTQELLAMFEQF